MDRTRSVPVFGLYGEWADLSTPGFVHVERIVTRAAVHHWSIDPHRHVNLCQAFLVTGGGGTVEIEGAETTFCAPWLLWVPAGAVHGFRFEVGTDGFVLTASEDVPAGLFRSRPGDASLLGLIERSFAAKPGGADEIDLDLPALFAAIATEATLGLTGADAAVGALYQLILVGFIRTALLRVAAEPQAVARSDLVRRFRKLVEERFRERWPLGRYARDLGVTVDRLHALCAEETGRPPKTVVLERLLLEAKRSLLFTTMTVSEIAFDLGFEDVAYFSRFFRRRTGVSALAYRRNARPRPLLAGAQTGERDRAADP